MFRTKNYLPEICASLALILLVGCSARGELGSAQGAPKAGEDHRIFVATSRTRLEGPPDFGRERSKQGLHFADFVVSVPPTHQPGQIEWPRGRPDPSKDFVVTDAEVLSERAFASDIAREITKRGPGEREAVIFIHGYNTNFAEGLYRFAQMSHDVKGPGVGIFYSWPSAAEGGGYVYDRDSVMFSRDGLQKVIELAQRSPARRITLVAHSMGSFLLMETLRQMSIEGKLARINKFDSLVLLSPDIDSDLFRRQVNRIHPRPKEFLIFGSREDRALKLSSFLGGGQNRVGLEVDPKEYESLGITYFDLTDFGDEGDHLRHFTAATSPSVLALIRNNVATKVLVERKQQQKGTSAPIQTLLSGIPPSDPQPIP